MAVKNPVDYLRGYIKQHFPKVERTYVTTVGCGAEAYCALPSGLMFRLFIPMEAPANARPLCNEVRRIYNNKFTPREILSAWRSAKRVWSFDRDYLPRVGLSRKIRIHIHSFEGVYMLIHVEEGYPDKLFRVSRMNDEDFTIEVEVLFKASIARLWGFHPVLSKREKSVLVRLRKLSEKV